jgi:hypothetical protein
MFHQEIGLTRVIRKVSPNVTSCHPIPIDVMHNQVKHKVKLQNKRQGLLVKCIGACLDPN